MPTPFLSRDTGCPSRVFLVGDSKTGMQSQISLFVMNYQVGGMSILLSLWMSLDVHILIVPYFEKG